MIPRSLLMIDESNSLLHVMYPQIDKSCPLCKNPYDTISHVANGCMQFRNNYTARHNRIVNILQTEIKKYNKSFVIHREKNVSSDLIVNDDEIQFANIFQDIQSRKPDLFLIDYDNMKCFILEVSCPFDAFIEDCYNTKFQNYQLLCDLLTVCGFDCKILVFVIGSLGHVHYRFRSGLKKLGVPNRVAKAITKYASVSVMIGTNIVWKLRYKLTRGD